MSEVGRKPDWQYWRQMPFWAMWEAVALSLDIEPKKVKLSDQAWTSLVHPFRERNSLFSDRLEILKRNCNVAGGITAKRPAGGGYWYMVTFIAHEFAVWAKKSDWSAPPELFALFADLPSDNQGEFVAPIPVPDYLNPNHDRYAPKLAAAVRAWEAVTSWNGTTPKQALEEWLREHATEFNRGEPLPAQAISDCAKVANWNLEGGAPKTPRK